MLMVTTYVDEFDNGEDHDDDDDNGHGGKSGGNDRV